MPVSPLRRSGYLLLTTLIAACAGSPPTQVFDHCPSSPNCVNSQAEDEEHAINGFRLSNDASWDCLINQAKTLPGDPRLAVSEPTYVRIEYTSKLMKFVDDLELKKEGEEAQVRSASRIGHSDWGVNRQRVYLLQGEYLAKCNKP